MKSVQKKKYSKKRGFTLLEMLAVILIITLIASVIAPKIFKGLGGTKRDIAKSKMAILEDSLGRFYLNCGRYPSQEEGLDVLISAPADDAHWDGPYIKKSQLLDPWGHPYVYIEEGVVNESGYDLICFGADGVEGGEGENEDIYND